jgi:hypothetical protein
MNRPPFAVVASATTVTATMCQRRPPGTLLEQRVDPRGHQVGNRTSGDAVAMLTSRRDEYAVMWGATGSNGSRVMPGTCSNSSVIVKDASLASTASANIVAELLQRWMHDALIEISNMRSKRKAEISALDRLVTDPVNVTDDEVISIGEIVQTLSRYDEHRRA